MNLLLVYHQSTMRLLGSLLPSLPSCLSGYLLSWLWSCQWRYPLSYLWNCPRHLLRTSRKYYFLSIQSPP